MGKKKFDHLTKQHFRNLANRIRAVANKVDFVANQMEQVGCEAITLVYMAQIETAISDFTKWCGSMESRVNHHEFWYALGQDVSQDPDLTELRKNTIEAALEPKRGRPRKDKRAPNAPQ